MSVMIGPLANEAFRIALRCHLFPLTCRPGRLRRATPLFLLPQPRSGRGRKGVPDPWRWSLQRKLTCITTTI